MSDDFDTLEEAKRDAGPVTRFDLSVVQAMEPYSDNPVIDAIGEVSELADQPPLVATSLIVLISGVVLRRPTVALTGLRMIAAHGTATGIKALIKTNLNRPRPDVVGKEGRHEVEKDETEGSDGEKKSFPSGHTAGAVAVARAVARTEPAAAPVVYTAAAVAGLIQIPRKSHFPSDVFAGFIIGMVAEAASSAVLRRLLPRISR